MKKYIKAIIKDYKWHFFTYYLLYIVIWTAAYFTGNIDEEQPTIFVTIGKFISVTFVFHLFPLWIFLDSYKSKKEACGFIFYSLIFNIYSVIFYFSKKKRIKTLYNQ